MSTTLPKIKPLWKGFTYFQHQIDGIKWMLDKEINGTDVESRILNSYTKVYGGFQCDDMGLGKTIQITSVIVNNPQRSTLIIAPLAMIETWSDILQKVGVAVYEANTKLDIPWVYMNDKSAGIPKHFMKMRPSVFITNYEKLYHNPSLFHSEFDRVVLDEAHKIRNYDGEIARCARKIHAKIRWVVTGTPLVNSLKDVVSLLAFIGVPHSNLCRWEPRYVRMLPDIVIHRSLDSLRSVIPGAPPVPEIHDIVLPFSSKAEEEFYLGIQGATESLMKRFASDTLTSQQAFVLLLRLRQISVHPQVYINAKRRDSPYYKRDDWDTPSTKLEKIKEIIEEDSDEKDDCTPHKYLIFCQFTDEMELIRDYLYGECIVDNIIMYNGSMNKREKDAALNAAKESSEKTVILVSLMSGNAGLNMQYCDRVIFVSGWWSDAVLQQAKARAVRIGQSEVVQIYNLHLAIEAENSINIDRLLDSKAEEKRVMLEKVFSMCSTGLIDE
jgi:SNF2 family DNA or RNA helicase